MGRISPIFVRMVASPPAQWYSHGAMAVFWLLKAKKKPLRNIKNLLKVNVMKKILISLFASSLLSWQALASTEPVSYTLDNGLQLVVKPDHRAPVVVSQIWYRLGASYEQTGKTGLSHVLEHMMFKGTEKVKAGEFSKIMAENGAKENAFTSRDYTAYFQRLEKSRLPISFELEADRMRNLIFDNAEFQKERQVVIEERLLRTDDQPISFLQESFQATAWQVSPYRNPTIGWRSDLENMTIKDLEHWYQTWYSPNNAMLVVIGDVEPDAVYELAKKWFGSIPANPTPPTDIARPEVEQQGIKRLVIKREAKLPYLMMGYKAPALAKAAEPWEAYALELLAWVLDGGASARLSSQLVREQEVATVVSASYGLYDRLNTLFSFGGVPSQGHSIADLETAIRTQIDKLQNSLVSEDELARVKAQLLASKVFEQDSMFYQGMQIGQLFCVGLDWRLLEQYPDKVMAITPAQLQTVAKRYLQDKGLTVGVLEPLNAEKTAKAGE